MGFNENFFRKIDGFILSIVNKKKISNISNVNNVVYLKEFTLRFSNLASTISGKKLKVAGSATLSGIFENVLFLPEYVDVSKKYEINVYIYIYRIIFTLSLFLTGFYKFSYLNDEKKILLFLLSVNYVHNFLFSSYPKFKKYATLLYSIILEQRKINSLGILNGSSLVFEVCLRKHLVLNDLNLQCAECTVITEICDNRINSIEDINVKFITVCEKLNNMYEGNSFSLINSVILWGTFEGSGSYIKNYTIFKDFLEVFKSKPKTLKETQNKEVVFIKKVEHKENKYGDMPVIPILQNIKTVEEYRSNTRDVDTSDELDDHFNALDDLNLNQVVRDTRNTESVYYKDSILKEDFTNIVNANIKNQDSFYYNEWNYADRRYKKKWCCVIEIDGLLCVSDNIKTKEIYKEYSKLINTIIKTLKYLLNRELWKKRQYNGSTIDLDSYVDNYASLVGKVNYSDDKFYLIKRLADREVVFYILVDLSLSTDSWLGDDSVLNLSKGITLIIGKVLNSLSITFAVSFFYSNTHDNCTFVKIKDYKTRWDKAENYIYPLVPSGYTRIGPAIRHSLYYLNKSKAKNKILLIISDSKPTDYDYYEGEYGVGDIRQAIRECYLCNVTTKGISLVEPNLTTHLTKLYGFDNFYSISNKRDIERQILKLLEVCLRVNN